MTHDIEFEELYAEYTQKHLDDIVSARLKGGGYYLPSISKAYIFYRFGEAHGYSKGKINLDKPKQLT